MTEDEWKEIMETPPSGHNHGRRRSSSGKWLALESTDLETLGTPAPVGDRLSEKMPVSVRKHGSLYTYVKIGCRCSKCKKWWADYIRMRRSGDGNA